MAEPWFRLALKLRNNALSKHLSEFDSPLVKRVNVPDNSLGEDGVLVQSDELTQCFRREPLDNDRVRWPVSFEDPVRHEPIRRAFFLHLLGRLTSGKSLGPSEYVCQEYVGCEPIGFSDLAKAMKSQGISLVPWWIN